MQTHTQYTRCPQCKTAFKVSDKMLAMAHGKVRCGACLQVFLATDYLLQPREKPSPQSSSASEQKPDDAEPAAEPESPVQKADPVESAIEDYLSADSAIEFEPDSSGETDLKYQQTGSTPEDHHQEPEIGQFDTATADLNGDLFAQSEHQEFTAETPEDDDFSLSTENEKADWQLPNEGVDSQQGSVELAEDESPIHFTPGSTDMPVDQAASLTPTTEAPIEPSLSEDSLWENDIDDDSMSAGSLELDEDFISAIESRQAAKDHPPSIDNLEADEQARDQKPQTAAPQEAENLADLEFFEDAEEIDSIDSHDLPLSVSRGDRENMDVLVSELAEEDFLDDNKIEPSDSEIDANLNSDQLAMAESKDLELLAENLTGQIKDSDIQPDPLEEFEVRVERKKTSLRTLIVVTVLLVVLSLLANNFWTNRQSLAWDDTWGGLTHSLCKVLPCELQPRRDVSQIRLRQRIVTPSENQENALDVKVLLTNEAHFDQPYPRITIKFSNSLGEQVAVQRFEVADYFPQKQDQMMPAGTEVHISFVTKLPHPDALGFEFSFD